MSRGASFDRGRGFSGKSLTVRCSQAQYATRVGGSAATSASSAGQREGSHSHSQPASRTPDRRQSAALLPSHEAHLGSGPIGAMNASGGGGSAVSSLVCGSFQASSGPAGLNIIAGGGVASERVAAKSGAPLSGAMPCSGAVPAPYSSATHAPRAASPTTLTLALTLTLTFIFASTFTFTFTLPRREYTQAA